MKENNNVLKKIILLLLLPCIATLLSGCSGESNNISESTNVVMPTVQQNFAAPIGDAILDYSKTATLYFPGFDKSSIVSMTKQINCSAAVPYEESLIKELLNCNGGDNSAGLSNEVKLSFYGKNPVEISGNVATVNLSASALQLSRKEYYVCCQCITNTLTELDNIKFVNILVAGKQIGIDMASSYPTGAFTRDLSKNIGLLYDQLLAKANNIATANNSSKITNTVTLYFPFSNINGFMAETRNITFSSQLYSDVVVKIIEEISEGPTTTNNFAQLPLLSAMLVEQPIIEQASEGSGEVVILHFDNTIDDMLSTRSISRASCFGALCYSISTYLPNVSGIQIYVGNEKVDHVMLGTTDGIIFDDTMKRADYTDLLMNMCILYLPSNNQDNLEKVSRPMQSYNCNNPRILLLELLKETTANDSSEDTQKLLSSGQLSDSDILGISLLEENLLVNLSSNFLNVIENETSITEKQIVYSMVDTLLENTYANKIYFFFSGQTEEDIKGRIFWQSAFYQNLGIVSSNE